MRLNKVLAALFAALLALCVTPTLAMAANVGDIVTAKPVYRLYNPTTTEHLYTTDGNEVRVLSTSRGWNFEGTSFYEPLDGIQVERLFNPSWGTHHYTEDQHEISVITTQQGWQLDGSSTWFTSGGDIGIHRLWNATLGQHLYTTDEHEVSVLEANDWTEETTSVKCLAVGVIGGTYSPSSATVSMRYDGSAWQLYSDYHTVTFDSQGGNLTETQLIAYGKCVESPGIIPKRDGYLFSGWYLDAACTSLYDFSTPVTSDFTLYAKWADAAATSFIVTFDSQGGSDVAPQTVSGAQLVTEPTKPTRSGYTFGGWYEEPSGGLSWNFNTDTPTRNMTLYAQWESAAVNYVTVTFDSQGGSAVEQQKVRNGGWVTEPTAPTRPGYTFDGWYLNGEKWNFASDTPGNDMTLVAKWTKDA